VHTVVVEIVPYWCDVHVAAHKLNLLYLCATVCMQTADISMFTCCLRWQDVDSIV